MTLGSQSSSVLSRTISRLRSQRRLLAAPPLPRLHEREVGEPAVQDQPDRVAVEPRGDQVGVVVGLVDDGGCLRIGQVDDQDTGRRLGVVPARLVPARLVPDRDHAVVDQQDLGVVQPGEVGRREELGPVARDVVRREVAVLDPHQE